MGIVQGVFGDNILPMMLLALGGALAVGTLLALVKPPAQQKEGNLDRPPISRSIAQILIGLVAAVWAIASML